LVPGWRGSEHVDELVGLGVPRNKFAKWFLLRYRRIPCLMIVVLASVVNILSAPDLA